MSYLAILRHGLSEANIEGVVAGHFDSPLSEVGKQQARQTASLLNDLTFHAAHTSSLQRASSTLTELLDELKLNLPVSADDRLKERNWGEIEGKYHDNRDSKYRQEEIESWKTWAARPPKGESYEDVSKRVVGYFDAKILPQLKSGQNVLLVGHNGMLKTLQRHLEDIPHDQTHTLNLHNCEVKLYDFDSTGAVGSITRRSIHDE